MEHLCEWRSIREFDGRYEVCQHGLVRRVNARCLKYEGRILRTHVDKYGYSFVNLYRKLRAPKHMFVHRLVAHAFLSTPSEDHIFVNHLDGNPSNNNVRNLEWCTQAENMRHAGETGLLSRRVYANPVNHNATLSESDVLLIWVNPDGLSDIDLARRLEVSRSTVERIRQGKTWKYLTSQHTRGASGRDYPKRGM